MAGKVAKKVNKVSSASAVEIAKDNNKGIKVALYIMLAIAIISVLKLGKSFFLPLVIAVLFWYLTHTLRSFLYAVLFRFFKRHWLAKHLSFVLAVIGFALVIYNMGVILNTNMTAILKDADSYQDKFVSFVESIMQKLGFSRGLNRRMLMNAINFRGTISYLISSISSLVSNAMMVFVYMMFIFIEQKYMSVKIQKLVPEEKSNKKFWILVKKIDGNMKTYITVKTFISLATALVGYTIMTAVGLQYAMFWALLLFIMNYIPTFGSIISSLLPMAFAVIQFKTALPIAIVCIGLIFTQLFFGNYLEPKILGRTLNLSPLIIIISLVVWGMIWGVVGMFLCVPIMSLIMVALSTIPSTRKIAVLLSENGEIVE